MSPSKTTYFIKRFVINIFSFITDLFVFNFSNTTITKKTVLIIKMDAIGDFFVWLAVANKYRILYPKSKYNLILLTNPSCVELAQKLNYFDNIISIKRKKYILNPFYRISELKKLKKINYDTIIYHASSREFSTGDLIIKNLTSVHKIGIKSDHAVDGIFWSSISNKWFTKLADLSISKQEFIRNNLFLEFLGHPKTEIEIAKVNLWDIKNQTKPYITIAPGARIGIRKWEIEKFLTIIKYILETSNFEIVLVGSKEEIKDGIIIQDYFKNIRISNKINKTSVLELCEIIHFSNLLIGNETSSVHIAAAVQTKSICILGGGHFNRFAPYPLEIKSEFKPESVFEIIDCFDCDWRCKFQINNSNAAPCIKNITENKVIDKIKTII
ncbi:MAG: lipopolysaccharide heptosyltransferase family protein [Cytophagales bacterium]|nr:MAG: lipopolysaccharide heptosyltransferase family protein [Cytophagales bacterium]